ncbi:S1 family peptidase [Lichenihabitans psoromatis]|uniref:S1 family peptidase n=1 Tax=Lichenihabitans psoromatis TaxID=2528642 RepID=UPI001038413B|nr:trypsin-like serine protease [Lichenihabitans psoromatis]
MRSFPLKSSNRPRLIAAGHLFGAAVMASFLVIAGAAPARAIVGLSTEASSIAPHVVMVLSLKGRIAGYCSGLVVAQNAVLTAAHCVPSGAAVKVHFRDTSDAPVLLDTAEIRRHPGYRADAIKTRERSIDLALIRLPAPLPDRFRPAIFGGGPSAAIGTRYRLAGFGLTREGDATSSGQLRLATVTTRAPLSTLLLWAEDPDHRGLGACTGDSGGPVFAADSDVVVALMVWSAGRGSAQCGDLTQAIWLSPQKGWINAVLAEWTAR